MVIHTVSPRSRGSAVADVCSEKKTIWNYATWHQHNYPESSDSRKT